MPGFADLRARLAGLARPKRLPARSDFLPEDFRDALPYMVLADVVDARPRDYRLRLIGTEVCRMYGADHTGQRLSEFGGDRWARAMRVRFERAVVSRMPVRAFTPFTAGRWPHADMEVLVQPMATGDDAPIDRLLLFHAFLVGDAVYGPVQGKARGLYTT